MKFFLLIVIVATSVSSEAININEKIDAGLIKSNELARKYGRTSKKIPGNVINPDFSISESRLLGLDSLVRTGDCLLNIQGSTFAFDFHYGFSLWAQTFADLKIYGQDMSAFIRIKTNSIHLAFTVKNDTECQVSLAQLSFERLSGVEFASSIPKYDGMNVDEFFQTKVLPGANKYLVSKKDIIEKMLQEQVCRYFNHEQNEVDLFHELILSQLLTL